MKKSISILLSFCMLILLLPSFTVNTGATIIAPSQTLGGGIITNVGTGITYTDLGTAISKATAGDTLRLSSGIYEGYVGDITASQESAGNDTRGALGISKEITITGPADRSAILQPSESWTSWQGNSNVTGKQKMLSIGGTKVTIENLTVDCKGKSIDCVYSSCADLTFNNVVLRGSKRSCLVTGSGAGTVTANDFYVLSSSTALAVSTGMLADIDISGGSLILNSGTVCGAMKPEKGTIVNNTDNHFSITAGGFLGIGASTIYTSPSYAAIAYAESASAIKTKITSALKSDPSILSDTAAYYASLSPSELAGTDVFGISNETVLAGLYTIASNSGTANSASKTTFSNLNSEVAEIKETADNTLASLSYSIDSGTAVPVPEFSASTLTYDILLPYDTNPSAVITVSGTASNALGDFINSAGVTLSDGTGTASADGWAYKASPQTKTYSLNFTVPKLSLSFVAGENGVLTGTAALNVFKNTPWSDITVPTPVANAGYKFDSWSVDFPETVTQAATYTANFIKDAAQWATISFASGGNGTLDGTPSFEVLKNSAWSDITVPTPVANAGYKFDSWSADFPANIAESITYTASFLPEHEIITVAQAPEEGTPATVRRVLPGDTAEVVKSILTGSGAISSEAVLTIYSGETELTDTAQVGTGMVLKADNGGSVSEYIIIISGDINGDATINSTDFSSVLEASVDIETLEGANKLAADVNADGTVDAIDAAIFELFLSGHLNENDFMSASTVVTP
ncbi:MAG: hypothetical protein GX051_03330 [Clostridiales bacterium]|nr:hypothetical protein [Clostridiales bacterium]